jgi:hypothetical protein
MDTRILMIILFILLIPSKAQLVYDPNESNCEIIKGMIQIIQEYIGIIWNIEYDLIRKEISQKYIQLCL